MSYTEIKGGNSIKIGQPPEIDGYEAALTNFNMISSVVFTTDEVVDVLKKSINSLWQHGLSKMAGTGTSKPLFLSL